MALSPFFKKAVLFLDSGSTSCWTQIQTEPTSNEASKYASLYQQKENLDKILPCPSWTRIIAEGGKDWYQAGDKLTESEGCLKHCPYASGGGPA